MPLDGSVRARPTALRRAAALEFHAAMLELRAAEVRRRQAQAAAVKSGVLPDHEASPMPVGTSEVVYADEAVAISVLVYAPLIGCDHASYVADLAAAGVDAKLLKRLDKKHAKQTKPAHKFTSAAVG